MHPLIASLENLKDSEIETAIQSLSQKYWMANSSEVRHQISMVLESYKNELSERRYKVWKKQHDEMNVDLEKLINIDN